MIDPTTITPIDRDEMAVVAAVEYDRMFVLLESLTDDQWQTQTVCDDWNVHQMVAHLLGAAEANASLRETFSQLRRGRRWAKKHDRPEIDGINAVQVADRQGLPPSQLVARLQEVAPKAIRGRRIPRPMRRITVENPAGGRMTMGHLMDRVYTRDQWMHRLDIGAAIGLEPLITADHDRRIIEDVVAEWATVHEGPWTLELSGPAGGVYASGAGGPTYRMDAVEWALIVSGRTPSDLDFAPVVF